MCKLYHKGLSRILLLLLALCLALSSLSACRRPVDDTPAPEQQAAAPTTTVTPVPEVTPAPAPTPVPEPPYKGDGSKYTYIMADERDRQWEEDIVFFANAFLDFLHGHPKLSGRSVVTYERNYSSGRLLIQNSSEYTSFYDEALRNTFLEEVNLLILSIPTRSDKEIIISLQKIAALLHDAHTVVDTSTDSFLGIFAGPLHTQTGMVYGILMARKEYESLLMSRLDGINGVPIEEIMERLRPLVSYDCEIHYQDRACSYSYLSDPDVLRYIGVMGPEDMAVLSLTGLDGKAYEYTVRASSTKTWDWNDYVEYVSGTGNDSSDMGIYTCGASNFIIYGTEKYWYETLADGKAVYIRLNSCPSDENTISFFEEAFSSFVSWIGEEGLIRIYSWSSNDLAQFKRECTFKNIEFPKNMKRWMDVQRVFPRMMGLSNDRRHIALKEAVQYFNISLDTKKVHDALYDSELTTELLIPLLNGDYKKQVECMNSFTKSVPGNTIGDLFGNQLAELLKQLSDEDTEE